MAENNLPNWRPRAGVNNTIGERKPVQPTAPKVTPEAQKPVQPKVEPQPQPQPQPQPKPEPAKPAEPKVEPPKPEPAKPAEPKVESPKPEPAKPTEPKVEPPKPESTPEPVQPAPEPVQPAPDLKKEDVPLGKKTPVTDVTNVTNQLLDTGKKHRNWTKTALPILLGALLIGGIIWAINAFKKKKQEKAKKAEEKATDKTTEKTEETNKESKEPEKVADEKEDLKNLNLSFEYENDTADLSPEDKKMAEAAAVTLAKHQEKNGQSEVVIASGASKNGSEKYNQEISSRRGTGMKDILSAGGVKNLDIVHGVGARAATLDSNSSDKHAASKNDRATIINAGLFTEKQYNDFYKDLKENAIAKGLTEAQADAYIEKFKAPSNGKVIDQFASNNPQSGKILSQLEKEEPAFKNKILKESEFAAMMGATVKTNGETVVATTKENSKENTKENETKNLSRDETTVKKEESKEEKKSKIKVESKETEKTLDTGKKIQENKEIKDKKKEPVKETKDLSKVINKKEITKTEEKKKENTNQRG